MSLFGGILTGVLNPLTPENNVEFVKLKVTWTLSPWLTISCFHLSAFMNEGTFWYIHPLPPNNCVALIEIQMVSVLLWLLAIPHANRLECVNKLAVIRNFHKSDLNSNFLLVNVS
jgi:hypothetical protein